MANTTEELAVALKEQDILAVLDTIIDPKVLPQAGKNKVDFLTVTKATDLDAIGAKVALIDGTTGINFDEIILDGDRATVSDIDDPNAVPTTLERFISIAGLRHALTSFGALYEKLLGNPTKDDQILSSKKDGTRSWIDAPSGGAGVAPADQAKLDHITVTTDIDLDGVKTAIVDLNAPKEVYALIGDNPTMKMEVEDAGHAAQMQVIDKKTGHGVATMEWLKTTQEFIFSLSDKDTGVAKATFEIKPDGHAYIGTKQVATLDDLGAVAVITDVASIVKAGVYSGTDVANAPVQGDVIIEAYKDAKGDFDLSCKGADMRRYEGGKPATGTPHWGTVAPDHLSGATAPADTLGHDGDIYFLTS